MPRGSERPEVLVDATTPPWTAHATALLERAVLVAVRGLAYGQIEVVVHGSRIVQITRSQKLRLDD